MIFHFAIQNGVIKMRIRKSELKALVEEVLGENEMKEAAVPSD